MEEALIRYLHIVGIIMISSALIGEHLLITQTMKPGAFKKLVITDGIYGLGTVLALVAGLLLWFGVGKPSGYYSLNPIFHIKLTLFGIMAILSIFPTVFFLKNRKRTRSSITIPKYVLLILRIEITLLVVIPLFATIMAKGIGVDNGGF